MSLRVVCRIARRERLELWRDGRLRLALVLLTLLLTLAALLGAMAARRAAAEVELARQADRQAWLEQGARSPHSAAHFGQYAIKPVPPLAGLDPGVDPYAGRVIWLEAHYQDPARFRAAEDRHELAQFGELTAAVVLQHLVPLALVACAFGVVAGERESGRLRLLLAQGVDPVLVVRGKLLAVVQVVALPLVTFALVGAWVSLRSTAGGDAWVRLIALGSSHLLYFVLFTCVAVAVSVWAPTSRAALQVLLLCWIGNCLVVPRWAADLAAQRIALPAASDFWQQVATDQSEGVNGHDPRDRRRAELEQATLAKYGVASLDALPVNFDGIVMQAGEDYGNRVFDLRWGAVWDAYQQQERWQTWLAPLAPSILVRGLSMASAGTDLAAHRHFTAAAEAHRRVINRQLNGYMERMAGSAGFDWKAEPDYWQEVAELDYVPLPAGAALRPRGRELLALLLLTLLAVGVLELGGRRLRMEGAR